MPMQKNGEPSEKQLAYWESLKTKMLGEGNHFYGKKHGEVFKEKSSVSHKKYIDEHPEERDRLRKMILNQSVPPHTGHKHSEESKRKMSESKKGTRVGIPAHSYGEEFRAKLSKSIVERTWGKLDGIQKLKRLLKKARTNPTPLDAPWSEMFSRIKTSILKSAKVSIQLTGKPLSQEHIKKSVEARRTNGNYVATDISIEKRIKTFQFTGMGKRKHPYTNRNGLVVKMRSSWEVKYAKYLDEQGILWQYELKQFKLSNGRRYWPDFYLPTLNEWHEVKGYLSKVSKEKLTLFTSEYPNETLILIDKPKLLAMGVL